MGKIETLIDESKYMSIETITGGLTAIEIIQTIEEYYSGKATNLILWDFSKTSFGNIKS